MNVIKKIFKIFFILLGLFMCGLGVFLLIPQIIENPAYVPCYVGVIFLTSVTALILFIYSAFNLPIPARKPKPKTFSKYLAAWFIIVIYVCGLGAALLWWGFTVAERLRGLLIAFAIIVTTLGVGALGGLFWQLIISLKSKYVLKDGIETEATFIDSDPMFSVESGKNIDATVVFQYCVKFRYTDGEKEIIKKSHTIYSKAEAKYFECTNRFRLSTKGIGR